MNNFEARANAIISELTTQRNDALNRCAFLAADIAELIAAKQLKADEVKELKDD